MQTTMTTMRPDGIAVQSAVKAGDRYVNHSEGLVARTHVKVDACSIPAARATPIRRASLAAMLATLLTALVAAFAPAANASVTQWTLDFPSGVSMSTNTSFSLYNEDAGDHVVYEDRGIWCSGINLGWSDSKTWQWRFRRLSGATGPLVYGERLALKNMKYSDYIHYEARECGINLEWTDDADHEWVIKGGTTGTRVTRQADNSLFNLTANDYLVHGWRPRGINLRWYEDLEAPICQYHDYC